jgi:hypothetical protein
VEEIVMGIGRKLFLLGFGIWRRDLLMVGCIVLME